MRNNYVNLQALFSVLANPGALGGSELYFLKKLWGFVLSQLRSSQYPDTQSGLSRKA